MSRTPRGSRGYLKGLTSLLLLVALLAGLPVLLAVLGGNPLPDHVPTGPEIGHSLTSPDDGTLFLAVLAIVGWIGWATFALSVFIELIAVVRRRPAVRLPGLRAQQRLAASLLAGVAVLIGSATAAAAIVPVVPAPFSVSAPSQPASAAPTATQDVGPAVAGTAVNPVSSMPLDRSAAPVTVSAVPAAGAPTAAPWSRAVDLSALPVAPAPAERSDSSAGGTGASAPRPLPVRVPGASTLIPGQRVAAMGPQLYIVERGDRLATIASRFLGDPDRYPELAQASVIEDPDVIRPGQLIVLPSGAKDGGSRAHAAGHAHPRPNPEGPGLYVVAAGDTLYDIADRFLGDPNRYPQLAAVSRVPEPDEIDPGLRLILPAGARDRGVRRHATGALLNPPHPGANTAPAPDERRRSTPAPATPARPAIPAPTRPAAPSAAPSAPASPSAKPSPTPSEEPSSSPSASPPATTPAPSAPATGAPGGAVPTNPRPTAPAPTGAATGAPGGAAPAPAPTAPAPSGTATGAPGGAAPESPASTVTGAPGGSTGGTAPQKPAARPKAKPSETPVANPQAQPAAVDPAEQQPQPAAFTRALLNEPLWAGGLLTGAGLLSALLLARRRRDEWRGKHRQAGRLDRHTALRRNPLVIPQPRAAGDLSTDDEPWVLPQSGPPNLAHRNGHAPRSRRNIGHQDRTDDEGNPLVRGAPSEVAVARLDEALRSLGAALADRQAEAMPDVVGAWLSDGIVSLVLTTPCPDPPYPWTSEDFLWTLLDDVQLEVPDDDQLPPLPTLVTVGSLGPGHLLLDLERLGVLTITGDPWRANDLLRFVAAELACNSWSDDVEITLAGFDPEQTAQLLALGGERADSVRTVAEGIEHIRARLRRTYESLEGSAAGHDVDEDLLRPQVLLAADPDLDETMALSELDAELDAAGRCAVAVVATIRGTLGRWPVTISEDGRLTADFVGATAEDNVASARLSRTALLSLAELLMAAP
jgi:nucleoid-associated protein YgaU